MFDGIRIIELAEGVFVPSAGAMLADWGAEVIKVEHPERGDGFRGLVSHGVLPAKVNVNLGVEVVNRGKLSVALDIASPRGRDVLLELVTKADVFLTSLLSPRLEHLGLSVDEVRGANPNVIYGRGHGYGVRGPDADRGAFDTTAFWARSGLAHAFTQTGAELPVTGPTAIGDRTAAAHLAFGIAAALFHRQRTGEATVVDTSLLASALSTAALDVVRALQEADAPEDASVRTATQTPPALIGAYRTSDGRFIELALLQPSRHFAQLCERIGRPDIGADPRFAGADGHARHAKELRALLKHTFETRTYADWCEAFDGAPFPWDPHQTMHEVIYDTQVRENDYIAPAPGDDEPSFQMPTAVTQFGESSPPMRRAPGFGQDTDEVLRALGYSWDEVIDLKLQGAVH